MQHIGAAIQFPMPPDVKARLESRGVDTASTPERLSGLLDSVASCRLCNDTGYVVGIGPTGGRALVLCACRRETQIEQYHRDSNIPTIYRDARLGSFDPSLYTARPSAEKIHAETRRYIERFDTIRAQTSGRGLYLTSRTKGSGKTMLACIIANELIDRGTRARFIGMAQLLADIKATYNAETGESEAQILHTAANAPLLVLDDVGVEKPTEWAGNVVYRLLDARLAEARPTIFTSNVPVDGLQYDERITDRIRRMAYTVALPEESVRSKLAAVEDMRMRAMIGGAP